MPDIDELPIVPLTIRGTTAVVFLTRGLHALIDTDAWPIIGLHRWHIQRNKNLIYAAGIDGIGIKMHRLLCYCPPGKVIDHKNRNTLDNRRKNLRPANRSENCANNSRKPGASGFKGVYERFGYFRVAITISGRLRYIGKFTDAVTAAHAYDTAAVERFGEFATTNFPIQRKDESTCASVVPTPVNI